MRLVLITAALLTAAVSGAKADDWQDEIAGLREDVQILQKKVDARYNTGVSAETNELQVQSDKRGEAIKKLNIKLENMEHRADEKAAEFDKIRRDTEVRIKMLEGKDIPADLSAPAPFIPETFDAPVADEAARTVVGDKIQSGELAPIDNYGDMNLEN